jgi:hypothetical protein
MPDGPALWLDWYRATVHLLKGFHLQSTIDGIGMLEADHEQLFGFSCAVARAKGGDWISGNALDIDELPIGKE